MSATEPFSQGTVVHPLPSTQAVCPNCGGELWSAWNPLEAALSMMFDETAGLMRVVCSNEDCQWQGSARDVKEPVA